MEFLSRVRYRGNYGVFSPDRKSNKKQGLEGLRKYAWKIRLSGIESGGSGSPKNGPNGVRKVNMLINTRVFAISLLSKRSNSVIF